MVEAKQEVTPEEDIHLFLRTVQERVVVNEEVINQWHREANKQ
jgi:hypothetical protein